MNSIWRAFRAETLKLKRTLALRMILLAPMLVALLGLLIQSAAVTRDSGSLTPIFWESHTRNSLTIWAVFLLPLLITVETALLCGIEHGERHWKHLFALPLPRYAIYCAKFAMAQSLTLLSTLLVSLLIVFSGWLLMLWHPSLSAAGPPPVLLVVGEALACWLAAGLILSTNLWVAIRWPSFSVPLGVGIGGTFFALFAASAEAAKYYPWLLPLDALSGGDRLRIALILGIGGGLLVAVLGCIDFARREESAAPNLTRVGLSVWASILLGFVGVSGYLDRQAFSSQEAAHTQFVTVDENVKLEVLDWGGSGRAIVLLSGLGDTAHVFGKFARALTGRYHVYGITRRGFGASSAPSFGYSADRLGDDVLAVIESLKLTKPVLVGHSIGGEELSSIGSRHPDKVAGLVYLDAAYSYAYYDPSRGDFNIDLFELGDKIERLKPGSGLRDPRPLLQELVGSLGGFERVLKERLQDLDALSVMQSATGPQLSTDEAKPKKPGVAAARAIAAGERKYSRIPVPILAIFALPHEIGADNPYAAVAEASDIASITGPQARAFEIGVPSARVVRLPHASHYIFQSNQYDVVREITAFVRGLPQL